jgi:hypothetical protein
LRNALDYFPKDDFLAFFFEPFFASGLVTGIGATTSCFSSSACFVVFLFGFFGDFFFIGTFFGVLDDRGLPNGFAFYFESGFDFVF